MYYGNEEWDFLDCEQECDRVCSIHDPRPNKVLERLFIGCQDSARNQLCLRNLKISHIVDMTGSKLHFDEFQYHSVHSLEDSQRADLLSVIEGCVSFIEEGMCLGSGVLVHCAAGVSRSAAVVAAYLMKREGMAVEEAVKTVQSARRIAQPNSGFLQQLSMWKEMGYSLSGQSKAHRLFRLRCIANEFSSSTHQKFHQDIQIPKMDDLHQFEDDLYLCGKCEQPLFHESHVINHHNQLHCLGKVCDWFYVEPIAWMNINTPTGTFNCPQCTTQVGSWAWQSLPCSCTTYLSPSFRFSVDKVVCRTRSNIKSDPC
eukprot:TRINITY_DN1097_c0_g1_i2.p1 TRINITY_DN1097_c0_g1~~TRINITY_DN1097_c0_g1_i2.p1  ORF type:complete len:314 (+),score=28.31 TRINITY_DN1097_c0_g1_i2:190-1131(+)